jgi:hypothetical protein
VAYEKRLKRNEEDCAPLLVEMHRVENLQTKFVEITEEAALKTAAEIMETANEETKEQVSSNEN